MDSIKRSCLGGIVLLLIGLAPSALQAAPCSPDTIFNPDASLADATSCGLGIGSNDSATDLQTQTGLSGWVQLDKDENTGNPDDPLFFTGTTGGRWMLDISGLSEDHFAIVLKSGTTGPNQPGPGNDPPHWVWFIIDTSVGANACTMADLTAAPGSELCGSWSMYGNQNGELRAISHMTVYGREGLPPAQTPEPGTLLLVAPMLAGLGLYRRRLYKARR